jgi:hypothetical protein
MDPILTVIAPANKFIQQANCFCETKKSVEAQILILPLSVVEEVGGRN